MRHVDEALLHAYLDEVERAGGAGALDAAARTEVELHLASCAACAALRDEAALLRQRSARVLRAAAPAVVELPGLPFDDTAAAAAPARRRSWVPLAWAATVVMALGAGWMASALLRTPAATPLREESMQSAPAADAAADARPGAPVAAGGADASAAAPEPEPAPPPRSAAARDAASPRESGAAAGAAAAVPAAPPPAAMAEPPALAAAAPPPAAPAAGVSAGVSASVSASAAASAAAREESRVAPPAAEAEKARARKAEPRALLQQADLRSGFAPAEPGWTELAVESAEEILGGPLFVLPGAAIESVRRTAAGVLPVRVRVTHRIDAGLVQVTQGRMLVLEGDTAAQAGTLLRRDGVWLVLAAPPGMNADSLGAALVRRTR